MNMNEVRVKFLRLRVEQDLDMENPNDYGGWKLYSFSRRHSSFKDPEELGLGPINPKTRLPSVHNTHRSLRNKLQHGLAYFLSYYEHGQCVWSLIDEGPQCRWDTARIAGLLVWEGHYKEIPKPPDERKKEARIFLKTFTSYCNGDGVWFNLEDDSEEFVDGCGGFYTLEEAMEAVREVISPQHKGVPIVVEGDYAEAVRCYHPIEGHEYLTEPPEEEEDDDAGPDEE